MDPLIRPVDSIQPDSQRYGGKAAALATLTGQGINVPPALAVNREAYDSFVDGTGLRGRIMVELSRKPFADMRWEEMWDASLRIRNMFARTQLPSQLQQSLAGPLHSWLKGPVAVRSSAPGEDSAHQSYAGLHDSFVNVTGVDKVIEHIKLVWSSLWSDAALLYRQDMNLDVERSTMAVLIQEFIPGDVSGVVFCRDPMDASRQVMEAVYGLNAGLVDGEIEPDRWLIERTSGTIIEHLPPVRVDGFYETDHGTSRRSLTPQQQTTAPLTEDEVKQIVEMATRIERIFGEPQDVEWTISDGDLYVLQARPITTMQTDTRTQYLRLRRSFDNLQRLLHRVEDELLPALERDSERLAAVDLTTLDDKALADALRERSRLLAHWNNVYNEEFIPLAHGARLFGQVYNDVVQPDDPFAFTALLTGTHPLSIQRNRLLQEMGETVSEEGWDTVNETIDGQLKEMMSRFYESIDTDDRQDVKHLIDEMASRPAVHTTSDGARRQDLETQFIDAFPKEQRQWATELLDLARRSYRLRDDDNIYLARLRRQVTAARRESLKRIAETGRQTSIEYGDMDLAAMLADRSYEPSLSHAEQPMKAPAARMRRYRGQPASQGIASGIAHVVETKKDLFQFKKDEILVCDAIDPTMTLAVPLAAGIVERRGGMLIHGAIVAREYGIPCVTGIAHATESIQTGDQVSVNGYSGVVTVHAAAAPKP